LPVQRKVGLFLLAVIVAVTLGVALVVSAAMYRLVSAKQAQEIRNIENSLSERFTIFEVMLRSQLGLIRAHMERVPSMIADEIERLSVSPDQLSRAQLDALAKKYNIESIYLIDRSHKIFQATVPSEVNLQFPDSKFTQFLDTVYGAGAGTDRGIDLAIQTGALYVYIYFGPIGKNYIIETSTDIRSSLSQGDFGWMNQFFFKDLFTDAIASNEYVKDVDIYVVNTAAAWSLLHVGTKLAPEIAERVAKTGRYEVTDAGKRLVTVYSVDTSDVAIKDDTVAKRQVIRKITYDVSLARKAVFDVFIDAGMVLLLTLPLVFWAASHLVQRQLLNPLFRLRTEARAIADGDLDQAVADTNRRDELGNLATSFAAMRDAVRRTILDLKETNTSIERFVPRAFLTLMGKPSIVSLKLGDNSRRNMTVLFSDMRDFTGQSEQMSPDENFAFINYYLERMGPVIRDHNGFIDKYIGDAIMALFEHADDALRASLAMLDALAACNADRGTSGLSPINIGIGLNSGSLMLGTIGEEHRMDGTVISDAVNLAARIETLTKAYGIPLLISQYTYDQLTQPQAFDIRPIDVVVVKGKTHAVTILEVFDRNDDAKRAFKTKTRDLLLSGVEALFRGDRAAARAMFDQCLTLFPGDPAATTLRKRCV
jgi:class 3 adenylate cyclase